ncbi:hypothetical protein [Nonomuraea roseoviolacea]|uniref:hypothetical protein n=1 Tax=Nonomuraea roseoviolacea TaxID=103837 RepID=UPI0020A3C7D8|nr:hypothetical protein [Nonomuraea roseoviolacea]
MVLETRADHPPSGEVTVQAATALVRHLTAQQVSAGVAVGQPCLGHLVQEHGELGVGDQQIAQAQPTLPRHEGDFHPPIRRANRSGTDTSGGRCARVQVVAGQPLARLSSDMRRKGSLRDGERVNRGGPYKVGRGSVQLGDEGGFGGIGDEGVFSSRRHFLGFLSCVGPVDAAQLRRDADEAVPGCDGVSDRCLVRDTRNAGVICPTAGAGVECGGQEHGVEHVQAHERHQVDRVVVGNQCCRFGQRGVGSVSGGDHLLVAISVVPPAEQATSGE